MKLYHFQTTVYILHETNLIVTNLFAFRQKVMLSAIFLRLQEFTTNMLGWKYIIIYC